MISFQGRIHFQVQKDQKFSGGKILLFIFGVGGRIFVCCVNYIWGEKLKWVQQKIGHFSKKFGVKENEGKICQEPKNQINNLED